MTHDLSAVCGPRLTEHALFVCWRPPRHQGLHIALSAFEDDNLIYVLSVLLLDDQNWVRPGHPSDGPMVKEALDSYRNHLHAC